MYYKNNNFSYSNNKKYSMFGKSLCTYKVPCKSSNYCLLYECVCNLSSSMHGESATLPSVARRALPHLSALSHKQHDFRKNVIEH
jgi:hypothetical protein